MSTHLLVPASWLLALAATAVFAIVYPLLLTFIATRRLHLSWRYFWYGVIIFGLFQLITRVPAVTIIQQAIAPQLRSSRALLYGWLALLVLTAALFEEVGRYIGYRWLMRRDEKTWGKAVIYGLGHGGLESIVLVGLANLNTLIQIVAISAIGLTVLPAATRTQVASQFAAIARTPGWLPLLGGWERLWTIPIQVAFSVLVLQVFRRGNIGWLFLAILGHIVVDGTTVTLQQVLPATTTSSILIEGVVAVLGLLAVWIVFAFRDKPVPAAVDPSA